MIAFENNIIIQLPDITNVEFKKIDKNYFKVILISFFLFFILLFLSLILLQNFVFSEAFNQYQTFIYTAFLTLSSCVFTYLILSFSKKKYIIREKDISYKSGLFTKVITTVPFSRIQHLEIDEKPISRIFGLSSLSVYTAGDSSDDLVIKGIKKEEALRIKEFINQQING